MSHRCGTFKISVKNIIKMIFFVLYTIQQKKLFFLTCQFSIYIEKAVKMKLVPKYSKVTLQGNEFTCLNVTFPI